MYITSACVIANNVVCKNDEDLFASPGEDVGTFLNNCYNHFATKYPKFYKMDSLSKLGWLAAEVLLSDSSIGAYQPEEKGLLLTNANSSLDTDLKYYQTTRDIPSPALFVYTLPNIVMGEICIRHHIKGENAFFVFEQFDADFIKTYAGGLLDSGTLKACICGWVDLLHDDYKAVLFLVEAEEHGTAIPFSAENILKIYRSK